MADRPLMDVLRELKDLGLTYADCVAVFGVEVESSPYAQAAHEFYEREGELEIDDKTIVSESDDHGAYVLMWRWVSDEEAGIDRTDEEDDDD